MQIVPGFVDKASGWLAGPILGLGIDGALTLGADTTLSAGANIRHYTTGALSIFKLSPASTDNYIETRFTGTVAGADSTLAGISAMSRGEGGTNAGGAACADSGTGARSGAGGAGAAAARVYARRAEGMRVWAAGGNAGSSTSGVNPGTNPDGAQGNTPANSYTKYRNTQDTNYTPAQPDKGTGGAAAGTPGTGGTGGGATANATAVANVKAALRQMLHEFMWGPNVAADGAAADTRIWRSCGGASGGSGGSKNTNGGTVGCGGGGGGGIGASGAKGGTGAAGTQSTTAFGTAVCGATGGSGGGGGGVAVGVFETAVDAYVYASGGTGGGDADPTPVNAGGEGGAGGGGGGGVAYGGTKRGTGLTVTADGGLGGAPGVNDGDAGIAVSLTLGAL